MIRVPKNETRLLAEIVAGLDAEGVEVQVELAGSYWEVTIAEEIKQLPAAQSR